jgi:nucleoside-diphosphate-sugar epimerase
MRVAVTGAAGKLGRAVVADLRAAGHDVVGADRSAAGIPAGIDRIAWDGRDVAALRTAIEGCAALIHLAAIPHPLEHPPEVVFGNNTGATFAALQAAADTGIRAAAIASSGSAYGTAYSPQLSRPRYVPVDEAHPLDAADPYALSKEVDERTAEMFVRRYAMSVAALRFHWVTTRDEQLETVAKVRAGQVEEGLLRGLWGYVDLRDAARSCRLAVETAVEQPYGFAALNIVAADALADEPLAELIARLAPGVEVRDPGISGAFAIERAAQVISWRPEHSWRDND